MVAVTVICTHNRASILGRGVAAALAPAAGLDAEVLVVDSASTEDTAAVSTTLQLDAGAALGVVAEPSRGIGSAGDAGRLARLRRICSSTKSASAFGCISKNEMWRTTTRGRSACPYEFRR